MQNSLSLAAGQPVTMSSLDLLDLINQARASCNEPEVRRNQFHDRIRDELDGDHYQNFVVENSNGTESIAFQLTRDQCMLVAMRESKAVRRSVLEKLNGKSPAELSRMDILKLAMESEQARIEAVSQRDEAVRTKAEIGSRREATAMATASAKSKEVAKLKHELGRNQQHATVIAVEKASGRKFEKNAYVGLRRVTAEYGLKAVSVMDQRYGSVKAWPAVAWRQCFGIDLDALFPGVES